MAPRQPTQAPNAPAEEVSLSFEQALARLETIVGELESGTLSLEQSLARYEEGIRLSQRLTHTLDEAEKRIERLVEGDEGRPPGTRPLELELKPNHEGRPVEDELPF
jgi:exodeoxyribonuclease VII small subunit